jgi:hypothetical protein
MMLNLIDIRSSSTPLGSKVYSLCTSYKPLDSSGVQQNNIEVNYLN